MTTTGSRTRTWVCALASLLLIVGTLVGFPSSGGSATAAPIASAGRHPAAGPTSAQADLTMHLAQVSPAVATPGQPVRLRVTLRNSATTGTTTPMRVQALLGSRTALTSRSQVRDFARSTHVSGRVVASTDTPQAIGGEESTTVQLAIPGEAISEPNAYGVLPLTIQAVPAPQATPALATKSASPSAVQAAPAVASRARLRMQDAVATGLRIPLAVPIPAATAPPAAPGPTPDGTTAPTPPAQPRTSDPAPAPAPAPSARATSPSGGASPTSSSTKSGLLPRDEPTVAARDPMRPVLHSFLPYHARKEYEPLEVAIAMPLTADPDPAFVASTGNARVQAWTRAIGAGSRIDRILAATERYPVTWAVDPALLGLPARPRPRPGSSPTSPSPSSSPSAASPPATSLASGSASPPSPPSQASSSAPPAAAPTPRPTRAAAPDPAAPLQTALRNRLAQLATSHPVWSLPRNDPDLAALTSWGVENAYLAELLEGDGGLARALRQPGVARVAWPVGGALSSADRAQIYDAYGEAGPTATLAPASAYDTDADRTATARRVTPSGTTILTYDDELSRLLNSTTRGTPTGEVTQQLLAETVALLAQSPGRRRTILLATSRGYDPDPAVLRDVLAATDSAPWLHLTDTGPLIQPGTPHSTMTTRLREGEDPLSAGPSPLTFQALIRIRQERRDVSGVTSVLAATPTSLVLPDHDTLDSLTSARWRGADGFWTALDTQLTERLRRLTTGISVAPSTINFFADHGYMQVTVVNDLDVEVHDVHVVLEPQGPPRLRIVAEPHPLTIRPNSRTTVRVYVEAVAAGVVPISAHLATPENTRLGTDATVRVRVQPTNGWIMLALGGLAGVVFLAGLTRALRVGRPRVTSEDLKEIHL